MKNARPDTRRNAGPPLYLISTVGYTPQRLGNIILSLPVKRWAYLGCNAVFRLRLEQALCNRVPVLPIGDALETTSRRLRANFLELMGKLAVENSSPLWWSTVLSSKNPHRSPLYLHACLMHIGQELLSQMGGSGIAFLVESPAVWDHLKKISQQMGIPVCPLRSPLRILHGFLKPYAQGVWRRLWLWRQFTSRRRELKRRGQLSPPAFSGDKTVLLFTWVDARNVTPAGAYTDPHFGVLPDHLKKRGYRIVYVPSVFSTVPFGETVDRLRQTGETFIFPEAILPAGDLLRSMQQTFIYHPHIPRSLLLDGVDISGLVREQIPEERSATSHTTALMYYRLIQRLKGAGIEPERIFHTFEGHNWSRVMCLGARTYMPHTQIVAYENLIFTPMLLSGYTSAEELRCLPVPDRIVTNGPLFASALRREGYPPDRIVAGAAIRHAYLWHRPPASMRFPVNGKVRVLAATGIDFADAVELVSKAVAACAGQPGCELLVKCHPAVDRHRVMAEVGTARNAPNVTFTDLTISDLLPQVHVLLYTYTSVCFEALRYGVPPVFVRPGNWLCMDQLDRTPEARWVAGTADDIRNVISRIVDMPDSAWKRWYTQAQKILRQSLAPVIPERLDRFILRGDIHVSCKDLRAEETPDELPLEVLL